MFVAFRIMTLKCKICLGRKQLLDQLDIAADDCIMQRIVGLPERLALGIDVGTITLACQKDSTFLLRGSCLDCSPFSFSGCSCLLGCSVCSVLVGCSVCSVLLGCSVCSVLFGSSCLLDCSACSCLAGTASSLMGCSAFSCVAVCVASSSWVVCTCSSLVGSVASSCLLVCSAIPCVAGCARSSSLAVSTSACSCVASSCLVVCSACSSSGMSILQIPLQSHSASHCPQQDRLVRRPTRKRWHACVFIARTPTCKRFLHFTAYTNV